MKNQSTFKMKITPIFSLFFILIFSFGAKAQTTKILFLGNSFTYTYDTPSLFEGLANSAGISVFVDEYTTAGIAVYDDQIPGHINNSTAQAKIASQQWDYVVVQDNMGGWVYDFIAAGPGNANVTLYNQIKANNPCTRIIYFSAWGPEGGVPSLGYPNESTQSCNTRMYQNFTSFNDQAANEIVSPVGKAWNQALTTLPSVDLYYSDNVHPSLAGSYLCATTLFATIFKMDPSSLSYNGGVSTSTANTFKSIAWDIVMNPTIYAECNLDEYTPSIASTTTTISTSGYSTYQWYLNGTLISGAISSTYTPTEVGTYTVIGYSANGCASSSMDYEVTSVESNTASTVEEEINQIQIYPNPTADFINIKNNNGLSLISIYDLNGKLIYNQSNLDVLTYQIDVADWEKGMYLIKLTDISEKTYTKRIVVK